MGAQECRYSPSVPVYDAGEVALAFAPRFDESQRIGRDLHQGAVGKALNEIPEILPRVIEDGTTLVVEPGGGTGSARSGREAGGVYQV
jgi:hypothetical protein